MHLIYFRPFPESELAYWDSTRFESLKLEGETRIQFQGIQACTGFYDGREHHSCINSALNTRQCPYCSYKDISKVYTRMDLTGYEHMEQELVQRPYSIYLSYFGKDVLKCGVCREERLTTRIKEQAATHFVNLMKFDNANDAYSMERLLQHTFGLKNAVRNSTKLKVIGNYDLESVQKILDEIKEKEPFSNYLVGNPKIEKVEYNLPEKFSISESSIDGEILGSRGSFLLFKNNGETFGIDMRRKKGEYFKFF